MAEWVCLESRYTGNRIASSNLAPPPLIIFIPFVSKFSVAWRDSNWEGVGEREFPVEENSEALETEGF